MYTVYLKRFALILSMLHATSILGMNVVRPYQILLRPPKLNDSWMQFYTVGQFGFETRSFGDDGDVGPLQIYQCNQNALAMLDGFAPSTLIGQKRIRVDASDDGVRGHFIPCADFNLDAAMQFGLRFFMPHHLSLAFYQPVYKMTLKDVMWQSCTQNVSIEDARVSAYLTNCLAANTCALGSLDINGWSRTGVGDTTVSLEWIHDYPQQKPMLHNVTINGRLGVTIPTSLKADEDNIFAFPYGNDGSFGLVFAIGLDLYIGKYIKAGLDVQLMHQFGDTRCRRIKTAVDQTDLLLLAKTEVFKDFGMTQQFSFYWEFYKIFYGASFELAYQFYKHGENTLYINSNEFSTSIANTAQTLRSYTTHDAFIMFNYDLSDHMSEDCSVVPYVSAFVDIPFNGRRAVVAKNAGFIFALNF